MNIQNYMDNSLINLVLFHSVHKFEASEIQISIYSNLAHAHNSVEHFKLY